MFSHSKRQSRWEGNVLLDKPSNSTSACNVVYYVGWNTRVSKGWHLLVATFLILKNYFTFSKTRRMLMFRFRFICTFLRVFIPAIMLLEMLHNLFTRLVMYTLCSNFQFKKEFKGCFTDKP